MPQIGQKSVLNGKPVRWSGQNYGWQSFASHDQLKRQGKFQLGAQLLDRLGQSIRTNTVTQNLLEAQQKFRNATRFIEPVENLVNQGVKADDQLPSSRVAQGGAIIASRAAQTAGIDPRFVIPLGMLAGGVSFRNRLTEPDTRSLRQIGPSTQVQVSRSEPSIVSNPIPYLSTKASKPADRPKFAPQPLPQNPLKEGTPPWANTPDLEATRQKLIHSGMPDPNQRFRPLPNDPDRYLKREAKEKLVTPKDRNTGTPSPLIKEFYSRGTGQAYRVNKGDKVVQLADGRLMDLKGAKTRETEVRAIPGNENVKVDWHEAHHERPLKDTADFVNAFDDQLVALTALDALGTPRASNILNRTDLPQRLHTGGPRYNSAHSRLRNEMPNSPEAGYPLEAQSGTNRWEFLRSLKNDEQRLQYLPYLMADADQNVRVAMETAFSENLLQPGNKTFKDPYIGNLAQQVLMPPSKEAGSLIQAVRRRRRG